MSWLVCVHTQCNIGYKDRYQCADEAKNVRLLKAHLQVAHSCLDASNCAGCSGDWSKDQRKLVELARQRGAQQTAASAGSAQSLSLSTYPFSADYTWQQQQSYPGAGWPFQAPFQQQYSAAAWPGQLSSFAAAVPMEETKGERAIADASSSLSALAAAASAASGDVAASVGGVMGETKSLGGGGGGASSSSSSSSSSSFASAASTPHAGDSGSGSGAGSGSGSGSGSESAVLSAAASRMSACPITRCPVFSPLPAGCRLLTPLPAQRSLGLPRLAPPIESSSSSSSSAATPVPFQLDVQETMNLHGSVVVEQSIVGRPLFLGQQLFSGLASTSATFTVRQTKLGEIEFKQPVLLEDQSVVARLNDQRNQGQATGFLSLEDYDQKIAAGTALSQYPTDLAGFDPYKTASAASSASEGKTAAQGKSESKTKQGKVAGKQARTVLCPHRPERIHAHGQSLLRCLSWDQCREFEGFSGDAYAYLKLGADALSWHREQLDGDTMHKQISGTSLILQVKPCHLPRLEAAMCDRVKASFGIVDLEPALSPLLLVPFFSKRQRITVGLLEELGIPYIVHLLTPGQVWISRGDAAHCFIHLGQSAASESLGVAINFVGVRWLLHGPQALLERLVWLRDKLVPAVGLVETKLGSHSLAPLTSRDFLSEVVNWCPHRWTTGWITRLVIDLHRHLSGQRFEDELAVNEIDFAGSELSRSTLAEALKQLSACRQLLLELTAVFRRLGSENIGESDDYAYLQKLLDSALARPVKERYNLPSDTDEEDRASGSGSGQSRKRKKPGGV